MTLVGRRDPGGRLLPQAPKTYETASCLAGLGSTYDPLVEAMPYVDLNERVWRIF